MKHLHVGLLFLSVGLVAILVYTLVTYLGSSASPDPGTSVSPGTTLPPAATTLSQEEGGGGLDPGVIVLIVFVSLLPIFLYVVSLHYRMNGDEQADKEGRWVQRMGRGVFADARYLGSGLGRFLPKPKEVRIEDMKGYVDVPEEELEAERREKLNQLDEDRARWAADPRNQPEAVAKRKARQEARESWTDPLEAAGLGLDDVTARIEDEARAERRARTLAIIGAAEGPEMTFEEWMRTRGPLPQHPDEARRLEALEAEMNADIFDAVQEHMRPVYARFRAGEIAWGDVIGAEQWFRNLEGDRFRQGGTGDPERTRGFTEQPQALGRSPETDPEM